MQSDFESLKNIPVVESDEFVGEVAVAGTADDVTDELTAMLEGSESLERYLLNRNQQPSVHKVEMTPEDYIPDFEELDPFSIDTPEVPPYTPPTPARVEKRVTTDHELKKASKNPRQLKSWIRSELSRGRSIEELVEYARKSDRVVARHIQDCYAELDTPDEE